jgi:hypothetical protein
MARAVSDAIVVALVDALERDPTEIACALGIPSISASRLVPARRAERREKDGIT